MPATGRCWPRLEPLFDDGDAAAGRPDTLARPCWPPPWVARANGLAGMLAFSLFANRIRLDLVSDDAPGLDL